MKNLYKYLILTCGLISGLNSIAQQRDVVWMHGTNGEEDDIVDFGNFAMRFNATFDSLETSFAPKSTVATGTAGVKAIANFLANAVNNNANVGDQEIILVGHSLGGMVAKEVDIRAQNGQANGLNARGIITMGAPLSGAKIANAMASPRFPNWMLGPGAPIHSFVSSVLYNLGRCTLPGGGGLISSTLYQNFIRSQAAFTATMSFVKIDGNNLWQYILPVSGQTWKDLKTSGYSAATIGEATTTPKLNLWGNITRPALQTVMEGQGNGTLYQGIVNYTRTMYNIYKWVPGIGATMSRQAVAAEGFFLHTIHGQYTNLLSDGVTYQTRRQDYRASENVRTCWQESRSVSERSCRKWGWFRWLCQTVVRVYTFTTCTTNRVFATNTVWYQFPIYPDTDGLISAASARAEGSQWRGTDIEVPDTDHADLVGVGNRGETELTAIFNGTHVQLSPAEVSNFLINR